MNVAGDKGRSGRFVPHVGAFDSGGAERQRKFTRVT